MSVDISQFYQVFFEEAEELLAEMERLLLALDPDATDMEELAAIFRTAHSLKGGASTFGMADMAEFTHGLESLLDRMRRGEMAITPTHVEAFLGAKDVLQMQLDGHRHDEAVDGAQVERMRARLEALLAQSDAEASHGATTARSAQAHVRRYAITLPGMDADALTSLKEELGTMGSLVDAPREDGRIGLQVETTQDRSAILDLCAFMFDPAEVSVEEEAVGGAYTAPDGSYGFFEPLPETSPAQSDTTQISTHAEPLATRAAAADKAAHLESTSIRVSVEKVDQLVNLIGELVITQAMIAQRSSALDAVLHERLLSSVAQLSRNTRDLQEAVMSIRMMPMDYVFSRFPRMVRDLATKLGKRVDFVTHGAATELDKGMIERIIDPLTHLVRNSVDHGIETPEARIAAGKPETGRLSLSAAHQGGHIVIEVSDDGAGLNRERILQKARDNGLPVSDDMPDDEVWQLIFAPGFSTAEEVTDVSGRGVGMDVVQRNIGAMGGNIDIRCARGFGTTISISVPLTLAILDGMLVKVGDEVYILPLSFVAESLQPLPDDVKEVAGRGRVVKVRGEYLPIIALHRVFGIETRCTEPSDGILVILESEGMKAAMLLDELLGQQQVVVKNLESNYRRVPGISGATILGDGGVSLILDVAMLVRCTAGRGAMSLA
ncbi:chemotaxis protein CheA [Noviherbaspirillum pedocola]|uniref:Chemotaxis protein CheA n=1 Tax=Noviherbaspirillum pedocola TaxID=2801341 RepID=A0A934SWK9_9BURK|nr:chemotaxis protein CheA [Noviherbaspirillum pedocola]MBK4734162.1 chemotaxis protein CheA [Noviherbaspirillum pedocola]